MNQSSVPHTVPCTMHIGHIWRAWAGQGSVEERSELETVSLLFWAKIR